MIRLPLSMRCMLVLACVWMMLSVSMIHASSSSSTSSSTLHQGRNRRSAHAAHTNPTVPPSSTSNSRYTRVADLNDGPSETLLKDTHRSMYLNARESAQWASSAEASIGRPGRTYTAAEKKEHEDAARVAAAYAEQYVMGFRKQYGHQAAEAESASSSTNPPPTNHASSGYDILARQQEKVRLEKLAANKPTQQQQQKNNAQAKPQQQPQQQQPEASAYRFAEAGVFVEEDVKVKGDKYTDSSSPPDWLVPSEDAKQGCPTTKPPPVPRMPPPPPPTPTPTWMSPFDEHNTPVFPQSDSPAPFYGMGPPPPGPPGNYLPLDTFLAPGPV